ncbi:MAG: Asp-tRNA(Asn)/Glu-tRNA(Gln) amidotransferase subunit GatA [Brevinema sp.]
MSLTSTNICELSSMLAAKKVSSVEITKAYLENIHKDQEHPQSINAYITVTSDLALESAKQADQLIQQNIHTHLTGIPIGIKDLINVKDVPMTCASKILTGYISSYDATVIQRLLRRNHMPLLGKLNLDEFAMGSSNETSYYGLVRNPHDRERSPGGSSGGSAAAIAGQLAPITLGTDTGGSIRQPAALCGCVGFKPTYGRISRYGATAFASSLDQIGPIAKCVTDAAMIYEAMAGYDPMDSTSSQNPIDTINLSQDIKGIKIGLPKEFFTNDLDDHIKERILNTAKDLEKQGAILSEVSIPDMKHAPAIYYIIAPAEASANLERFDGIRYGQREQADILSETYIQSRSNGFGAEVKRRIMLGTFILSSESYDSFFIKAQQVRAMLIEEYKKVFDSVDLLLGPTTPTTAFKLNEKINDPVAMYLNDIFTISANLVGSPAISVPVGTHNNLPIGLQLTARCFDESTLFRGAKAVEQLNI